MSGYSVMHCVPRWNACMPILLSWRHEWYTTAVLYSTLSRCLQVKKNVQQQSRLEADENKEKTATEKRLHIQASDRITLCGIYLIRHIDILNTLLKSASLSKQRFCKYLVVIFAFLNCILQLFSNQIYPEKGDWNNIYLCNHIMYLGTMVTLC